MSKRNVTWLVAIVGAGIVVWLLAGALWGLLAAVAVLVVSEVVERALRRRRRAASGSSGPSVGDIIATRRRKE